MTNCLAELAGSTDDETQWKHLNYQVLLNLRSDSPAVCACVLDVVRAFVDREAKCLDRMRHTCVVNCFSSGTDIFLTKNDSTLFHPHRRWSLNVAFSCIYKVPHKGLS